jgi:hypothetical protein
MTCSEPSQICAAAFATPQAAAALAFFRRLAGHDLFRRDLHRLLRIVQKAPERAVQVSAEEVMTGTAPEER